MTLRLNSISVNAQYIQLPAMWLLYAMQAGVIGFIIYELIRILRKRITANRKHSSDTVSCPAYIQLYISLYISFLYKKEI